MESTEDKFESIIKWLEQVFALRRLDNALLILSSLVNVFFAIGNAAYGGGIISFILPLYLIAWVMPIWSGYFVGAILRGNISDRIRGWMYLLSGTTSYLVSPIVLIWIPLPLSFYQVDPLVFPKSISMLMFFNALIALFSWCSSGKIVYKLFRTVIKNGVVRDINLSYKPFLFTYIAIVSFSSLSCLYIWDSLRAALEPNVFPVNLYLYAAIVFTLLGIFFEYLALKAERDSERRLETETSKPSTS